MCKPNIMTTSVLMCVSRENDAQYLADCFQSLLSQTMPADEIIVVIDGPIPNNLNRTIEEYTDQLNFEVIKLNENVGFGRALNIGIARVTSDLIIRVDPDDICVANRIQLQTDYMKKNSEVIASSGNIVEFCSNNGDLQERPLPTDHAAIVKFAKKRSPLSHPASCIRTQPLKDLGGYPPLRKCQDYALWSLMLVKGYRLGNSPELLVRMRTDNMMSARRGYQYFLSELKLLDYQRDINFLNYFEYLSNLSQRFVLRFSPNAVKFLLYKYLR